MYLHFNFIAKGHFHLHLTFKFRSINCGNDNITSNRTVYVTCISFMSCKQYKSGFSGAISSLCI